MSGSGDHPVICNLCLKLGAVNVVWFAIIKSAYETGRGSIAVWYSAGHVAYLPLEAGYPVFCCPVIVSYMSEPQLRGWRRRRRMTASRTGWHQMANLQMLSCFQLDGF